MVGRDEEIAQILAFLGATGELPAALLIEGEPGIGKTTIWRTALELAGERSYRILSARPASSEAELAFALLADLLEDATAEVLPELPPPQRRALEIALLLEDPGAAPPQPRAIAAAFLTTLRLLARDRPLLLAVDDIQGLDSASRGTLEFAVRRLEREPIALLLTRRAEADAQSPLGVAGAFLDEHVRRLPIGPLSVGALHELLRTRLGLALSRPTLRRLAEESGGNPFFALELARALAGNRVELESGEPLPVPDTLQGLVADRLGTLPPAAREALVIAALAYEPTVDLIGRTLDGDPWERVRPAVEAEALELEGARIRFAHPLVAAAVRASLDLRHRRDAHRRLADVVTAPEERARHLALAADAPNAEVAAALERAASQTRVRGAAIAAAELAEQALRMAPQDLTAETVKRRVQAASYWFESGDVARARRHLEAAAAAAPPGPLRAEALSQLARVHGFGADVRVAARLYRQALVESDPQSSVRAEVNEGIAVALMRMLEDLPSAARRARKASELAERRGDVHLLADFLAVEGMIAGLLGRPQALGLMERATSIGGLAAEAAMSAHYFLRGIWGPSFMSAILRIWLDDVEYARAGLADACDRAVEIGDESSLPLLLRWRSYAEWLGGNWPEALRLTEEGRAIAAQTGQLSQQAVLVATKALVLAHLGRAAEARETAGEGLRLADETGAAFGELVGGSALGFLELSLGRPADAYACLSRLVDRAEAAGIREPGAVRFVPDAVEALIGLGRIDEAEALLARLERRARKLARPSALGASARCRGLLAAVQGDLDSALAGLLEAVDRGSAAIPFERARTLLALGQVQRRAKQKRRARESLERALRGFEALGAALWVEKARDELARISGRAPSGGELTPTERRLAELVAEGRSNKEVAAALFVSSRTVETKLSRIYAKLGVHSRTELAHRLTRGTGTPKM
jgi:DNA-binding CsgD family transcriptional regulator/DNA polymerase III delta prime subunit